MRVVTKKVFLDVAVAGPIDVFIFFYSKLHYAQKLAHRDLLLAVVAFWSRIISSVSFSSTIDLCIQRYLVLVFWCMWQCEVTSVHRTIRNDVCVY